MTATRLATFGPPLAHTQAGTIPLPAERRFQLLAYLATEDRWVARERLLALFWPDHTPAAARRNLRRLLFDLRQLSWLDALDDPFAFAFGTKPDSIAGGHHVSLVGGERLQQAPGRALIVGPRIVADNAD